MLAPSPSSDSDVRITAEVLDALRRSAGVDERRVSIRVSDGEVTLSGPVGSHAQRLSALRAARLTRGVRSVLDSMTVSEPTMEDTLLLLAEQLEALYTAELRAGPFLRALADAASSPKLAEALRAMARQSETRLDDLRASFADLGRPTPQPPPAPRADLPLPNDAPPPANSDGFCRSALGLVRAADASPSVRDAALVAIAEHMAHERIAGYAAGKTLAGILAYDDAADRLQGALSQERHADAELTRVADAVIERASDLSG